MNEQRSKVLFLPKWYPNKKNEQSGVFIQKHARAVSRFCDVLVLHVMSYEGSEAVFEHAIEDQKEVKEVIIYFKRSSFKFLNMIRYLRGLRQGLKIMKERFGTPDLVHVHVLLRPGVAAWYLKKRYGWPYLITEHWSGYLSGAYERSLWPGRVLTKWVVKRARAVTTVSSKLKDAMIERGFQTDFYVIPNIIESPVVTNGRDEPESKVQILVVADLLDKIKNITGVLHAFSHALKERNDLRLHIIGGGKDEQMIKEKATELDLLTNGRLRFHGIQNNKYVLDFMTNIDFLVINSRIETFSIVTGEALAAGKPVIATRCGGPEDLINEKNGILIPIDDTGALTRAMLKMADQYKNYDPEEIRKVISDKYGFNRIGEQFFQLYRKIMT